MNPFVRKLVQEALHIGGRALVNAFRNAVRSEQQTASYRKYIYGSTAQNGMSAEEAQKILALPRVQGVTRAEVEQQAERFLAQNDPAKGGSAFLQAKVIEARETLLSSIPDATER